jgi:hypothetical protein
MTEKPHLTILIADSIRYGSYKKLMPETVVKISLLLDRYEKIREVIDLPQDMCIRFRPIRGDLGRTYNKSRNNPFLVELDVRQNIETFKDTLLHELVHIEQFYQKRLKETATNDTLRWKGKKIQCIGISYNAYRNLPWEIEAEERAKKHLEHVFRN